MTCSMYKWFVTFALHVFFVNFSGNYHPILMKFEKHYFLLLPDYSNHPQNVKKTIVGGLKLDYLTCSKLLIQYEAPP